MKVVAFNGSARKDGNTAILVSAGNAISRKLFDWSSNAWLELQWYLFGAAFMLSAAYTLQRNEHIRIDIVSARLPNVARNVIELIGHCLMLLPFSLLMLWEMWPSMSCRPPSSCQTRERSS